MDNAKPKINKKGKKIDLYEKDLFLHLLKEKKDILLQKKYHKKYMDNLKFTISDGLILLNDFEINSDKQEARKRDLQIKKNFLNNIIHNNSNIRNKLFPPSKKIELFQKNTESEKTILRTSNSFKRPKNYFTLREIMFNKYHIINRSSPRIRSSLTNRDRNYKLKEFFNSNFSTKKDSHFSPSFNDRKNLTLYPSFNTTEEYKQNKICSRINNHNYNYTLFTDRVLSSKKNALKTIFPSSPQTEDFNVRALNKIKNKAQKKIRNTFNNTILKFNRNKLKIDANRKNIKKRIKKLSESKVNNKYKDSMKEYFGVKKMVEDLIKKKKKKSLEFKKKALSHKKFQNQTKLYFKKAFKLYLSPPFKEMKTELSNFFRNKYFIVDEDNNPYKFRVFKYNHIF